MPNNIIQAKVNGTSPSGSWTSGFWPGILWYIYEYTGDEKWRIEADSFTNSIIPTATGKARSHDVGSLRIAVLATGIG